MPTVAVLRAEAQALDVPNYKDLNKVDLEAKIISMRSDVMTSGQFVNPMINMRLSDLRKIARKEKVKFAGMTKDQLIEALG